MATCIDPRHLVRLRVELMGSDGSGNQFRQTAFTHDVSLRGARIAQAPSFLSAATVIDVKYRGRRSRFRVVWIGLATNDIGLLSLDPNRCIWGSPLPGQRIHSHPPSPPTVTPKPLPIAKVSSRPDLTEETQQTAKPVGFYCKDKDCQRRRAFHRIPDQTVVWDIWPQKFECPVSGHRHEYSKGELRSAGYV